MRVALTDGKAEYDRLRAHLVPDPIRGGTWFYCPWQEIRTEGGRASHVSCGIRRWNWASGSRFRTAAAYRRHYRKQHGLRLEHTGYVVHTEPITGWCDEVARFRDSGAGQHSGIVWPPTEAERENQDKMRQVNELIRWGKRRGSRG